MATEAQIRANRENAKKGGRKKGAATIEREKVKEYIAQRISEEIAPIVDVLIGKAKKGDVMAIREMFDRGFGKANQAVDVTSKGESIKPDTDITKLADEAAGILKGKKL